LDGAKEEIQIAIEAAQAGGTVWVKNDA